MSSPSNLFQTGAEAVQQKRFTDAIPALEAFCRNSTSPTRELLQAQMYLVQAYYKGGQPENAIALCQHLSTNAPPQVQAWATNLLATLTAPASASTPPAPSSIPPDPAPPSPPPVSPLSDAEAALLLTQGNRALKTGKYADAVKHLEAYTQRGDRHHKDYAQAQMWLTKAYKGNDQKGEAIALCRELATHEKPFVHLWAKQFLQSLVPDEPLSEAEPSASSSPAASSSASASSSPASTSSSSPASSSSPSSSHPAFSKAGRAAKAGVTLAMKGTAASLALASGVTLSLLSGMILTLCMAILWMHDSTNPGFWLMVAIAITIAFNLIAFFLSPLIMDLIQGWLYGTRWVQLSDIERQSPEAARVIRRVCQEKKLTTPRLGIINDQNPTAFTYGSLPNSARLVVSKGLFTYLDDDEVATVYAHELGHIVHWDFAVMTLAAMLVQITYLLYVYIDEVTDMLGDSDLARRFKGGGKSIAIAAYVFYVLGEYLMLYLSRTREYYADHFAAEITGNPNGLSRALVKIAYGILEEGNRNPTPSKMLQGTRALGIADPRSAAFTGTAYRVASEPAKVGRVFLWDMFNPWAGWMELNSTHPLTGKRVRALSTYAEQLGLEVEFDMASVVREGRTLSKKRLYGTFVLDIALYWADWLGLGLGLLIGAAVYSTGAASWTVFLHLGLLGGGIGILFKTVVMYPDFNRAPNMDILTLMSDPYASPLRGRPVKLAGTIIGRGDTGNKFGSDLKLQDPTGLILLRYSSRFGPLGNLLFGWSQADSFVQRSVSVTGWFRRGIMPLVDLVRMDCPDKWTIHSYHRFWSLLLGAGLIVLSFVLPPMLSTAL